MVVLSWLNLNKEVSDMKKSILFLSLMMALVFCVVSCVAAESVSPESLLVGGAVPVTWEVSEEHLMVDTQEARDLFERIDNKDYPSLEELKAHPVVAQLDSLSAYYKALYGITAEIDTPEREQIRRDTLAWFLARGSARTTSVTGKGKHYYAYDGPLKSEYKLEVVLGLPSSGKSSSVADPDSETMSAFILDCDMIKAALPEYKESHGAGADAVHLESMNIMKDAMNAFLSGDMNGTNVILPIVATDLEELLSDYIRPFEAAGYHVNVKFKEIEPNVSAAKVVRRELKGGQLINSAVAFSFGTGPEDVYRELSVMLNPDGIPYGQVAAENEK